MQKRLGPERDIFCVPFGGVIWVVQLDLSFIQGVTNNSGYLVFLAFWQIDALL
jgi:hypothetical protein